MSLSPALKVEMAGWAAMLTLAPLNVARVAL